MIPRADIEAVSVDVSYNELVTFIDKTKHQEMSLTVTLIRFWV